MVDSSVGPIIIDNSLYGNYKVLIAIIPHFSRSETLAITNAKFNSIILLSSRMQAELECGADILFDDSHNSFAEMLLNTHRGVYYYSVHGRTNGEISMMMSEIAYDCSRFCGCELEFNSYVSGLFEMKNDLCTNSYIFALVSLLFAARNYSSNRKAKMDVYLSEMGTSFEFGFEIAEEFKSSSLLVESKELKNFKFRAENYLFDCDFYQNDRVFAVRGFPWFKHPNSADIKERRKEFIYNI